VPRFDKREERTSTGRLDADVAAVRLSESAELCKFQTTFKVRQSETARTRDPLLV